MNKEKNDNRYTVTSNNLSVKPAFYFQLQAVYTISREITRFIIL